MDTTSLPSPNKSKINNLLKEFKYYDNLYDIEICCNFI